MSARSVVPHSGDRALGGIRILARVWEPHTKRRHWSRFVLGGAAIVSGVVVSQRAVRALGLHATRGLEAELVTDGPYRYSRNPQYVAYIAVVVGYAAVCNSGLSLAAAGLAALSFFLGPFAEESWLRERMGARFEAYASQVPRFLGRRRGACQRL